MCGLICDVISLYDKIVIDNQKKDGNQINLHKSPYKRCFRNGIHALLRRADARGSADIIDHRPM